MEDFSRRISVQAQGASNYLVIELQEGEALIPYCVKMIETNNIFGLLNMHHQIMDGLVCLKYDIGGKVCLRDFMAQRHLGYQNGVLLLRNLSEALLHLGDYFLSTDMCYLEPEYLFVGDGLSVYLACIPAEKITEQNSSTRLKAFYEKLLSEYFATADCSSYDEMFKWVYKTTLFDLETFTKKFLNVEQSSAGSSGVTAVQIPPVQPVRQTIETAKRSKQPVQQAVWTIPPEAPAPVPIPSDPASESPAGKMHELTNMLEGKMSGVQALYFGVENSSSKGTGDVGMSVAQQQSNNHGFNIPGRSIASTSGSEEHDQNKKVRTEKVKRAFWPFGVGSKNVEPNGTPVNPVLDNSTQKKSPSDPAQRKLNTTPRQNTPQSVPTSEDDWDSGTILVDSDKNQGCQGDDQKKDEPKHAAYFVHNGEKVMLFTLPFIVGKSNSEISLQYAIYDNNKISRSHATFLLKDGKYFIRDNQSRNGTSLNGHALLPLQAVELNEGDEIKLYDEVLIFHKG